MLNVTCAIIIQKDKFLVTQRDGNSDHPFQWEFPGGKIKDQESPEDCIKREIMEELSIEVTILRKMFSVTHDYGFKKIKLIPFLCSLNTGEIRLNDHHDFQWISMDEIGNIELCEADRLLINLEKNRNILKEYLRKHMDNTR